MLTKTKQLFIYSLLFILINSCATSNTQKHFKQGKPNKENYTVTLPFEIKNGWIVLPVKIENKTYNFILDTGTPTLVSKELATSLNMKVIDAVNAADVYNNSEENKYTKLETIGIGTLDFVNTIALINDFNATPMWSALNIDGFIGSNLMQHAIWDIDFEKKQITITDNELNLNLPENIIENKLFIGMAGLPSIATKINGQKVWNFLVDLGYNGDIVIPFLEFEKQIENSEITEYKKSNTKGVIGIYGKQKTTRTSYTGIIDELEFGNTIIKKQKVYSEQYLEKRFGLDFFKNYRVIINWKSKKIKLIENLK